MKVARTVIVAVLSLVTAAVLVTAGLGVPDPGTGSTGGTAPYEPFVTDFPTAPVVPEPVVTPVADTGGFDWTTLLIGVGVGVAAVLVLEGAVHVVRHPPTGHRPAATH